MNEIECTHDGIWLIDKSLGMTSFGVVQRLRRILGMKKIGHAGTLDPLATGLMIVCSGRNTKLIEDFMGMEKEYTGTIYLGAETESYDLEHPPYITGDPRNITQEDIKLTAQKLTGVLQQIPPAHSAIKIEGKRAYSSARKGKNPELKPREIVVHSFDILAFDPPEISFRIVCSKGTYIRTLAYDFGKLIGTGAYLSSLKRTAIGNYRIDESLKLRDLNSTLQTW